MTTTDKPAPERRSRQQLQESIQRRIEECNSLRAQRDEERKKRETVEQDNRSLDARADHLVKQMTDLKQRLATAEFECQRMRGYIARVQEDDVVREEMVTVGDPEGERHLKPKRQHASFQAPNHFDHGSVNRAPTPDDRYMSRQGPRAARHWITYGEPT